MSLLIDADVIAMQAVTAAQDEIEFEPDVWQLTCDLHKVWRKFEAGVDELMAQTTQEDFLLCLSDPDRSNNFRKQLNPGGYKANRAARKPVGFKAFEEQLRAKYGKRIRWRPRLEADDVLGILATRDEGKHVIWSIDKDLMQIPGLHLVDGDEITVEPIDGDLFFLTQVLTGDTVDGYSGCPGVGPVKAKKIIQKAIDGNAHLSGDAVHCCWEAILNNYVAAGLTEDDALMQARMAFILRHSHYNVETGKIRLWKAS